MTYEWDLEKDGAFILPSKGSEVHTVLAPAYFHKWGPLAGPSLDGNTEIAIEGVDHPKGLCDTHLHSCVRVNELIAVVPK